MHSVIRPIARPLACLAIALATQGAHAAYAGLWFQCQPRWTEEKNHLMVDVHKGERSWKATWGRFDSASGQARKDQDGNLQLRGCHVRAGKVPGACDARQPPLFATLPKAVADGKAQPVDEALRRGTWLRTDKAGSVALARQCAALRPRANG
jgi:hypothetical protein